MQSADSRQARRRSPDAVPVISSDRWYGIGPDHFVAGSLVSSTPRPTPTAPRRQRRAARVAAGGDLLSGYGCARPSGANHRLRIPPLRVSKAQTDSVTKRSYRHKYTHLAESSKWRTGKAWNRFRLVARCPLLRLILLGWSWKHAGARKPGIARQPPSISRLPFPGVTNRLIPGEVNLKA